MAILLLSQLAGVKSLTQRFADGIVFYSRVASLYTRQPDTNLAIPVKAVTKNQIANTWQAPRGTNRKHDGQDIFAPRGTPILSATQGYVMKIGENALGGRTVSVIGAGGRIYYYAHLESYAPRLAKGDEVTTETVLGYVGTTGNAQGTPPHLHFGVYAAGGAIDPYPLLNDRQQNSRSSFVTGSRNARASRVSR